MSFIFAEKYTDQYSHRSVLSIHSDTKIGLTDYSGTSISNTQLNVIEKYGIIKTTIIAPEICISFAGNNILNAVKLFRNLHIKHCFSRKTVADLAYEIHTQSNSINDIEFIISSYEDDKLHIDCIKEGQKYIDCSTAWIGSYSAFHYFQKCRLDSNNAQEIHHHTFSAFDKALKMCGDKTVGGFHIPVYYNYETNSFQYKWYLCSSYEGMQIVEPGKTVKLYGTAAEGGYTIQTIPISIDNIIVEFEQISFGILYSRQKYMEKYDAKTLFGIMLPMPVTKCRGNLWKRTR